MFDPWMITAAILLIQPLIAIVWGFILARTFVTFTTARIGQTVDNRIEHAVNQIED